MDDYTNELKKAHEVVRVEENSKVEVLQKYYYICEEIKESKATSRVNYIRFKEVVRH